MDNIKQEQDLATFTYELLQINDLDTVLERALSKLRNLLAAEAGSIYLVQENQLHFSYTQNEFLERSLPPGKKLIYNRFSLPINDQSIAGYVAHHGVTLNLPDVYQIGNNHPYHFDGKMDERSGYRTKSMLTLPILSSLGKVLGVVQLINARDQLSGNVRAFSQSDENLSQMFVRNIAVALSHIQVTRSVISKVITLLGIHTTRNSSLIVEKVAVCAAKLFEAFAIKHGFAAREVTYHTDLLRLATRLYDIGKLLLPSSLFEPGRQLNEVERNMLKEHTWRGAALFDNETSEFAEMVKAIALEHHEAWDGSGYPGKIHLGDGEPLPGYAKPDGTAYGKRGEEINLDARIVAIADAYVGALYADSDQPGIEAVQAALKQIQAVIKLKFDPQIVAVLLNSVDEINAELGIVINVGEKYEKDR